MRIAAIGYEAEALKNLESEGIIIDYFSVPTNIVSLHLYDAFFLNDADFLSFELLETKKITLINSVIKPLDFLETYQQCFRVNHWPTFVENKEWEIVGKDCDTLSELFTALKRSALFVKNEVGLIAPRILAMIINEAHYAEEESVSSPTEIDVAMKLGTGYPQGPFEWGKAIGLKRIYNLLLELSKQSERYNPNNLLIKMALNK
jgi:3-hydroxybutyryl-CoA dehydrogenase